MTSRNLTRTIATTAALAAGAAGISATAAPGEPGYAAKRITAAGVGKVKLGKTFGELRDAGLIGRLRPGCELGGPGTRFARLKPPLSGTVDFTRTSPRRAKRVTVRGGAKARGVGIGATVAQIKTAFPEAKVDHSTEQVFRITLVKIPKDGGGRMWFGIPTDTKKITMIGVPNLSFCD
jgi:hypothetical protein